MLNKSCFTVTSDARDKTIAHNVPHGLDFVNKLNPVSFNLKNQEKMKLHMEQKIWF
jgi:hypothetical protein